MTQRISGLVYAALTLLAVAVAATAKGYIDSMAEFAFVVLVSAIGLTLAHLWSQVLAHRLAGSHTLDTDWLRGEAASSAVMLVPAAVMIGIAWVASVAAELETAITLGMIGLLALMVAYTWLGVSQRTDASRFSGALWALGTAAVGAVMIVFKVVA